MRKRRTRSTKMIEHELPQSRYDPETVEEVTAPLIPAAQQAVKQAHMLASVGNLPAQGALSQSVQYMPQAMPDIRRATYPVPIRPVQSMVIPVSQSLVFPQPPPLVLPAAPGALARFPGRP
mmetsp:Transcript_719/g.895  ORF Transcript_719/g.895 Transcript_719/m.895 type:complete len:121 (-) Transcript_719:267-629(-)